MFNCSNPNSPTGILENGIANQVLEIRDNGLKIY
jgi:hypothetical protein